jgi:hypothetical protein
VTRKILGDADISCPLKEYSKISDHTFLPFISKMVEENLPITPNPGNVNIPKCLVTVSASNIL